MQKKKCRKTQNKSAEKTKIKTPKNTKENRVTYRGVFEFTDYDVMLQEILGNWADRNECSAEL